jgi:hypothetical protein
MKNLLVYLVLLIVLLSCSKSGSDNGQEKYPYYFTANINGSSVKYEANDIDSRYECGISMPSSSQGFTDYDIYEGTLIQDGLDDTKNNIYVHILKYFNHEPSVQEREAMLKMGSYGYGVSKTSSATVNGASINYTDGTGKSWHSELGSQAGSSFNITEISDNPDGTSGKIFKASFSCKLYDGSGGVIQVNNAVIRGKIFNP